MQQTRQKISNWLSFFFKWLPEINIVINELKCYLIQQVIMSYYTYP